MIVMLTLGTIVLWGCKTSPDVIQLKESEIVLKVGETYHISVIITSDAIVWTSDDASVASVSETGVVTAVGAGKAVITATVGNASANVQVTVTKDPDIIQLKEREIVLFKDSTYQIRVVKTTGVITWSSANTEIASVSDSGLVYGVSLGETVITANVGDTCAQVHVIVTKKTDVIKLKETKMKILVMGHEQIEVEKASGPIVWASQDSLIAIVDENGNVFGVSKGKTFVSATVGEATASVEVSVVAGGLDFIPTVGDLMNDYDVENKVVLCVFFESGICNDVVIAGSYNEWSTDVEGMIHMEELEDFYGWYVAEIPFAEGMQAKPVQLKSDGTFSWNYQTGDVVSWEYKAGNRMTIEPGYDGESNVGYPTTGAYIYISHYFKHHWSPCVAPVYHDYTVILKAPNCGGFEPAIIGDFNGWSEGVEMSLQTDGSYKYTFNDYEGHAFKFKALGDTDWTNQIQLYNASNNIWYDNPTITLGTETTISLDYSTGSYNLCASTTP